MSTSRTKRMRQGNTNGAVVFTRWFLGQNVAGQRALVCFARIICVLANSLSGTNWINGKTAYFPRELISVGIRRRYDNIYHPRKDQRKFRMRAYLLSWRSDWSPSRISFRPVWTGNEVFPMDDMRFVSTLDSCNAVPSADANSCWKLKKKTAKVSHLYAFSREWIMQMANNKKCARALTSFLGP